jgi:uncharacterized membrane protein YciS (DUF1049 family)
MKDYFLNRQLERIEKEANDDFAQILEFGAKCYPTRELHQLLHQLDIESYRFSYLRRVLFLIGASTTFWIAFCFLFQSLEFNLGVILTLVIAPLSIITFVSGMAYINYRFRNIKQAHLIERIITEELERRRKDASIF